jgi:hypothetical protein
MEDNIFYQLYESITKLQTPEDYKRYYDIFAKEYNQSTGAAWSYNKFAQRAQDWTFYGDNTGFIAVRFQNSGYVKLVGMAGSMRGKYKGIKEIIQQKVPLWGAVSEDIAQMASKMGFVRPPVFLIKMLLKAIPAGVFGTEKLIVNSDGSITISYGDVGTVKKYFIATPQYFMKLIKDTMFKLPALLVQHIKKLLRIR